MGRGLDLSCRPKSVDSCFRWQKFFETYRKNNLNFYHWPKPANVRDGSALLSNLILNVLDFLKMSLAHSLSPPKVCPLLCLPPEPFTGPPPSTIPSGSIAMREEEKQGEILGQKYLKHKQTLHTVRTQECKSYTCYVMMWLRWWWWTGLCHGGHGWWWWAGCVGGGGGGGGAQSHDADNSGP